MQYLEMRKQVGELLGDLGHSGADVAMTLSDSGVRGTPKDVRSCAIAVYLSAVLGADTRVLSVEVNSFRVRVISGRFGIPTSVALPEAVQSFIRGFDQRCYPELIRDNRQQRPSRAARVRA